jgi:putative ABC transport system permease protein
VTSSVLDAIVAASRSLARSRRSTILTVVCIALGVAASATALSLAWTVTLRPLPFPDGERLARVWLASVQDPRLDISIPDITDISSNIPAFDRFAGTARTRFVGLFEHGAERIRGEAVTPEYFEMLGVAARQGRTFGAADHQPGSPRVALISAATWRRFYGGNPNVIGRTLRTEAATFEIVGVLEDRFDGTIENDIVEFWIPLSHYLPARLTTSRTARQSWVIGRLAPGATLAQAQQQLDRLTSSLVDAHGMPYRGLTLRAEPFAENWRAGVRGSGILLLGAAMILLLIAVVNVSGLALARTLDRRREFALRVALGADSRRIAMVPFTEAVMASVVGGAIGAMASAPLLDAFLAMAPIALPRYLQPELSGVLILIIAVLCGVAAIGAGLLPALEARKASPGSALKEGSRGDVGDRHRGRVSRILVTAQVALTTALVIVAALLGRSFQALNQIPLGFRTDITRLAVTASPADRAGNPKAFRARLVDALAREPGVQSVGLAWLTLPPWDADRLTFAHTSLGELPPERAPHLSAHAIDASLFGTMGIRLVAGRGIEARDDSASAPVVVISESLAGRLGGVERALGSELRVIESAFDYPSTAQIVGVAGDVAWDGFGEQGTGRLIRWGDPLDPRGQPFDAFYSLEQVPDAGNMISIAVRVSGDPAAAVAPLSRVIGSAAPLSAVHWASAMTEELALEYRGTNFAMFLSLAFGLGALFLAGIGLFAILAHTVSNRIPEFAVRMALGASPAVVRSGVIRSGMILVVVGCALGGLAALAASRLLAQVVYGVSPADPLSFAIAAGSLMAVAVVACWLPASRAARVDPMQSLRGD